VAIKKSFVPSWQPKIIRAFVSIKKHSCLRGNQKSFVPSCQSKNIRAFVTTKNHSCIRGIKNHSCLRGKKSTNRAFVWQSNSGIEATHYQPFIQLSNPEITDTQIVEEQGFIIIYANGNRLLLPSGTNLHLLRDCVSFSV